LTFMADLRRLSLGALDESAGPPASLDHTIRMPWREA